MNEVVRHLRAHRSIRKYQDSPLTDEQIHAAVVAGQAASTSSAVQAYTLMQITDPSKLERLVELTGGQSKVAHCGAFFVVCGDMRRHELLCQRQGQPFEVSLETFIVAVVDASLFAQNVCVAFESMGLGICYIGGLRNDLDEVDELLDLPTGVLPLYGLCVGEPAERPSARPRLPAELIWCRDHYPTDDEVLSQIDAYDTQYQSYMEARGAAAVSWSMRMVGQHAQARRVALAHYYRTKGVKLS
ncbi:MAG TPA: hypothetical protein DCQ06_05390 [Myxococcales bacterium]|nr:hypothetical protein [Myxococcales bacterium]HAN31012.1 hypothetical protein [Myxococcales bacterium]